MLFAPLRLLAPRCTDAAARSVFFVVAAVCWVLGFKVTPELQV